MLGGKVFREPSCCRCSHVIILANGQVAIEGTPDEVYDHPATPFVLQEQGDPGIDGGHEQAGCLHTQHTQHTQRP